MLIGLLLYLQKINNDFIDVNLRAMLADEYILIDIALISSSPGLTLTISFI